jgi:hypothetical protein
MAEGDLPEGFDIRFARADDNEQLVAVSRASAIRVGDARVIVDPGDDYFAAFRLMDEWTAVVVTHHDKVVGVQCGCSFPGAFGPDAEPARISQMIHTRFDPDYTRLGLWSHLNSRMLAAGRERAASFERGEGRALASTTRSGRTTRTTRHRRASSSAWRTSTATTSGCGRCTRGRACGRTSRTASRSHAVRSAPTPTSSTSAPPRATTPPTSPAS